MKKRFLLASAAALIMAANVSAQDITPDNYVFSNAENGLFVIDGVVYGKANSINNWKEVNDPFTASASDATKAGNFDAFAGGVYVEKWVAQDEAEYKTEDVKLDALRKGTNIVDLGGKVGKVLCICGNESDWTPAAQSGEDAADGDLTFFLKCQSGVNTRVQIVYQQYSKSALAEGDETVKGLSSQVKTSGGVAKAQIASVAYTDFATKEPDPSEFGKYNYKFDNTKWRVAEGDYSLGTAFPYRLAVSGALGHDVVTLIKSITITQNPEGEPKSEFKTYEPATSIESILSDLNKVSVLVVGNNVVVSNLNAGENVAVYSVNGSLVKSFVADKENAQVNLTNGLYLVKTQTGTVKVLVK